MPPGGGGERARAQGISASADDGGLAAVAVGHVRGGPRCAEAPLGGRECCRWHSRLLGVRRRSSGYSARRGRGRGCGVLLLHAQRCAVPWDAPDRRQGRPGAPGGCRCRRREAVVLLMEGGRVAGRMLLHDSHGRDPLVSRHCGMRRECAFGRDARHVPAVLRKPIALRNRACVLRSLCHNSFEPQGRGPCPRPRANVASARAVKSG